MPRYVALLGGINVGKRRVKMEQLRRHFQEMGFDEVVTLLASGNVAFRASQRSATKLEQLIEGELKAALGYAVTTFVRSSDEVHAVVHGTPFPPSPTKSHSVQVLFFKSTLSRVAATVLNNLQTEQDRFGVVDREVYWRIAGRLSDSEVWKLPEVKALALPDSTTRNLNTLQKLDRLFNS